uniref:Reverse transcriptase domain-containing protein n=1 Tax=Cannabis sativa TaxID=3483 RepID=A0A803PTP8_CANSA
MSPNKSAFLTGRQITDNIVIANEIIHAIHSRKSGKLGWAAIKLDMEKAFDRVEWSFISHFLHHIGAPPSFTYLISTCLSTVTYQLSLNGKLSNVFSSTRGIRQGDPLSPYLSLIVAEGLSAAIRLHEDVALFSGIKICRGAPSFSHLLFADDSMLFVPVSSQSSEAINNILLLYFQASGQSVNRDKSSILFSPNTSPNSQSRLDGSGLLLIPCFILFLKLVTLSILISFMPQMATILPLPGEASFGVPNSSKKGLSGKSVQAVISLFLLLIGSPKSPIQPFFTPIEHSLSTVSVFVNPDRTWNTEKLQHFLPTYQAKVVLNIPLDLGPTDSLIWGFHHSGTLTVNSAYHLAQSTALTTSPSSSDPNPFKDCVIDNVQDFVSSFLQNYQDAQIHSSASNMGIGMVFMQGLSHIQKSTKIFKLGASSPIFAEAQALYEGLQWCMTSNLTPRFIFSDCLNLVSKVNGNWHDYSPLSTLIQQIRTFLSRFPEAPLLHVSRQRNGNAHSLAKLALRLRDED